MSQRRLLAISLVFAVWTGTGAWAGGSIADASTSSTPAEHQGGVYRRPLGNNPITLDPARLNDIYGRTVANQIFDGLVQLDKSLAVRPAIAETWRASRDGLVWTFTLRKGVRFHNGREVTADDFVYSFTRILDPATHSTGASFFSNIRGADAYLAGRAARVEGLRALDRYTLRIELAESRIPFVVNLAVGFAKVVPREVVQQLGAHFGLQPVGTGPFKFVDWSPNTRITPDGESRLLRRPPASRPARISHLPRRCLRRDVSGIPAGAVARFPHSRAGASPGWSRRATTTLFATRCWVSPSWAWSPPPSRLIIRTSAKRSITPSTARP